VVIVLVKYIYAAIINILAELPISCG